MVHRFERCALPMVALLALCVAADRARAQEDEGSTDPIVLSSERRVALEDELDDELLARQTQAILGEAASLRAHAWAGDYYEGDGLGTNISMALAPQGGVSASWAGCLGRYAADAGPIEVREDGTLQLRFASSVDDDHAFPRQLAPVPWGERRYLIEPSEMLAFVNAINLGREPRAVAQGRFLLARDDETRPVAGLPALPARWLPLIRSEPVAVRVTAVAPQAAARMDNGCLLPFRLSLDHGADIGLVAGSELELTSPGDGFATVEVLEVGPAASVASLELYGVECATGGELPAIGWVFSTGALGFSPFDEAPAP